jgi:hypothetical protein
MKLAKPFLKTVPVIILISLGLAILFIYLISGRINGFTEFGFRACGYRHILAAIMFGVLSVRLAILASHLSSGAAMPEIYFVVGADSIRPKNSTYGEDEHKC